MGLLRSPQSAYCHCLLWSSSLALSSIISILNMVLLQELILDLQPCYHSSMALVMLSLFLPHLLASALGTLSSSLSSLSAFAIGHILWLNAAYAFLLCPQRLLSSMAPSYLLASSMVSRLCLPGSFSLIELRCLLRPRWAYCELAFSAYCHPSPCILTVVRALL